MENFEKKNALDSLLSANDVSVDNSALKDAVKKGDKNALINSLSEEDRKKLNSVLNDKKALSEILKTPEAKALMKSLFGGKNG